jgi:hypothetical protein
MTGGCFVPWKSASAYKSSHLHVKPASRTRDCGRLTPCRFSMRDKSLIDGILVLNWQRPLICSGMILG